MNVSLAVSRGVPWTRKHGGSLAEWVFGAETSRGPPSLSPLSPLLPQPRLPPPPWHFPQERYRERTDTPSASISCRTSLARRAPPATCHLPGSSEADATTPPPRHVPLPSPGWPLPGDPRGTALTLPSDPPAKTSTGCPGWAGWDETGPPRTVLFLGVG